MRPSLVRPAARLRIALTVAALAVALAAGACVKPRDITQPVPDALERLYPDSANYLLDAAVQSMIDEAMQIELEDRTRGLIESRYIDIGSLRATTSREGYPERERMVRFRFRTRSVLGGTQLIGEAVYRPIGGGSAMERMVRPDHAAREVLDRLYVRIDDQLQRSRAKRREAADTTGAR